MSEMTLEEIRFALKDRKISLVAKATGLTRQALYDILNGKVQTLRLDTYTKLVSYFTKRPPAPKRVRGAAK